MIAKDIADAIAVLIKADNVEVNKGGQWTQDFAMLRSHGDFAGAVMTYEGLTLEGEVFATFDKKAFAST